MSRPRVHMSSDSATDLLLPQLSVAQPETKKKRRSGKKEQLKRQLRQERKVLDDDTNSDDTEPVDMLAFESRNAGPKGLGLFATRDIEPGERLIQEVPLFVLPKQDTLNAAIVDSFMHLRPDQRAAYLKLSSYTTSIVKTQSGVVRTSAAEDGTASLPDVASVNENSDLAKQVDHRSCASDVQPLSSGSDTENSCKSPNSASGSDDPSLKNPNKLEPSEPEDTSTSSPVPQPRVDSPIWDVDDLEDALQTTITDSDGRSGVDDSIVDDHQDHVTDECEMTEALAATVVNIWRTNSYMLDDGITLDSAGIGLTASRLNHSCVPNVYTAFNSTSGHITVQALKPITAGDELCTAYINGAGKLRSERRAQLSMWGFTCTCIACADGRDESRRRGIKTLMTKVEGVKMQMLEGATDLSVAQVEQTIGDLLDQATLMSDEGLLGPDLADVCFGAARCCMLIGRREEAGALQSSGFGILLRGYGIDNPICTAALQAGDMDEA
ncbi:SET domain-containing protein [Aureobasidium sp. EXF-10728]|nr:SET domain-containing protein [Aureobasidium sp. EXF-10728]